MSKELAVRDEIALMDKFANKWLTGQRNPTTIARELGIPRAKALDLIDEYKAIIHNDPEVKARAAEALYEADKIYDRVLQKNWELVDQTDDAGDFKTKATVLKNIADVEGKRVDMLQKAGLYDDAALGDELAEQEEKMAAVLSIIKEVSAHCPNCKVEVARRISKLMNKVEPIVVEEVPLS